MSHTTADTMRSILFQLPHAIFGLNIKASFHLLATEMLDWYVSATTGTLTVTFHEIISSERKEEGSMPLFLNFFLLDL